jgi:hypothetical protein
LLEKDLIKWYLYLVIRTTCEKQSWVSSDVYGFARAIEAFGLERYKKNSKKVIQAVTGNVLFLFVFMA